MNKSKIVKKLSPAQLSVKRMGGKALAKKRKETMSPEEYSAYFIALQAKRKVRRGRFSKKASKIRGLRGKSFPQANIDTTSKGE